MVLKYNMQQIIHRMDLQNFKTTPKVPDDETALNYVVASDAGVAMG